MLGRGTAFAGELIHMATPLGKAAGKKLYNTAFKIGIPMALGPVALGAASIGAVAAFGKASSFTEQSPTGALPGTGARNLLNKLPGGWGLKMSYEMARYTHLNPGFALGAGGGLMAGAAYTAASYNRSLPPFTNPNRMNQQHPYNLGASGDIVLAAHNMR